ncbi:MAG: hypothetical protein RLY14_995 [Planctomycetota bacterium]|jgi:phosphoglycolate phosphatase
MPTLRIEPPAFVLFDIDGTLIDAAGAGRLSLEIALIETFGCRYEHKVALQGRTDLGIFSDYLEFHGITANDENLQAFRAAYLRHLPHQMTQRQGKLCPGVSELVGQLSQDPRFEIGLLTGNSKSSARIKLQHFGIDHPFDFGIYGENAHQRIDLAKDIEPIVSHHFQRPCCGTEMIVVGDTPDDVALGKAVGAYTIAVLTGWHHRAELEQATPDLLLESLDNAFSHFDSLVS